ncbi:MAG TPA: YggT family protein [bacterium]|jgi:YggT family protein|nr:YggT family protein [bacterium]
MFVLANFLAALTDLLDWLLGAAIILVVVRALLSWVNPDPYNAVVRAINTLSEPLLKPFRRLLPPWRLNGLDLSPIFAVLSLEFVRRFVIPTLWDIISRLKSN